LHLTYSCSDLNPFLVCSSTFLCVCVYIHQSDSAAFPGLCFLSTVALALLETLASSSSVTIHNMYDRPTTSTSISRKLLAALLCTPLLHFLISFISLPFVSAVPMCGLKPPKSNSAQDGYGPPVNVPGPGPYTNCTTTTGKNGTAMEEVVMTGWYPGWLASSVPPSSLSWEKWTQLTYAFACVCSHCSTSLKYRLRRHVFGLAVSCSLTGPDPSTVILNSDDQQVLPNFVEQAHSHVSF
jgi:hypothetical protein